MESDREAELAKAFGLDKAPALRREAPGPAPSIPQRFRPKFYKALQLVDRLASVQFWKFIPDFLDVDQSESSDVYSEGNTFAILARTDIPPPVDERLWGPTRILPMSHPECRARENFYRYLRLSLGNHARELGCYKIAPPLIFETIGDPANELAPPFIGLLVKFLRRAADGQTLLDQLADIGVLVPKDVHRDMDHAVMPVDTRSESA